MARKIRRTTPAKKSKPAPTPAIPRAHGRFDYSPIVDRPVLRWPNGARVALWVIPNIEHFLFDRPGTKISGGAHGRSIRTSSTTAGATTACASASGG